ncbi:hypothetical protein HDV03_001196 [Kappamyces sp. JEL0829]|nr:hypothetical protein HDV03_001196 [Kappamyces sp. JEL0829]
MEKDSHHSHKPESHRRESQAGAAPGTAIPLPTHTAHSQPPAGVSSWTSSQQDSFKESFALLQEQECLIHPQVLKYSSSDSLDFKTKQQQFKETCFAIEIIIKQKLYKLTAQNLEQYFLKEFNVSRAQVYRLLDCAAVLRCLEGLSPLPHRYKLCKDLKAKAGLGPECRALWEKVIGQGQETDIDTYDFDQLPNIAKKTAKKEKENTVQVAPLSAKSNSSSGSTTVPVPRKSLEDRTEIYQGEVNQDPHRRPSVDTLSIASAARRESGDSLKTLRRESYPDISQPMAVDRRSSSVYADSHMSRSMPEPSRFADSRSTFSTAPAHSNQSNLLLPPPLYRRNSDVRPYPPSNHYHPYARGSPSGHRSHPPAPIHTGSFKTFSQPHSAGDHYYQQPPLPVPAQKRVFLPSTSSRPNDLGIASMGPASSTSRSSGGLSRSRPPPVITTRLPPHPHSTLSIAPASARPSREWEDYSSQIPIRSHVSTSTSPLPPPALPPGETLEQQDHIVQQEFLKCQQAMTNLAKRGYQLTPFIDGQWRREPITEWRIVPTDELKGIRLASVQEEVDQMYDGDEMAYTSTPSGRRSSMPDSLSKLLAVAHEMQ